VPPRRALDPETEPAVGSCAAAWVRAAAALWGLGLAMALSPWLQGAAPPGQLPGAMKAFHLDAAGPFRQLAALLVLPFLSALAIAPLAARPARRFPILRLALCLAFGVAPFALLQGGALGTVVLLGAIGWILAAAGALRAGGAAVAAAEGRGGSSVEEGVSRGGVAPAAAAGEAGKGAGEAGDRAGEAVRRLGALPARRALARLRASRRDVVLLPVALVCYFALLDLAPAALPPAAGFMVAAFVTVALRLAAARLSVLRHPASALALAPLGILLQLRYVTSAAPASESLPAASAGASTHPTLFACAALAWVVGTTLLLALLARSPTAERRLRTLLVAAVYPLFVFAYPLAVLGIDSPLAIDFFEDGHELLPAAEMADGLRPYVDIVPPHGLLTDGALDLLVIRNGHSSTHDILWVRRILRCANFPALYAVALAATGLAEGGLLAALLSVALFPSLGGLRPVLALFALACAVAAVRARDSGPLPRSGRPSRSGFPRRPSPAHRWLAAAGVLAALAFLGSPDFAAYSAAVAAVVALRSPRRLRAVAALAAGSALATALILATFAARGFAGAFLHFTLHDLPRAGQAYILGPLLGPDCLHSAAALLHPWQHPDCRAALLWLAALLATATALSRRPLRATRTDGLWMIALWSALAAASYAERCHLYATLGLAPFLISAVVTLHRSKKRPPTNEASVDTIAISGSPRHEAPDLPSMFRDNEVPRRADASVASMGSQPTPGMPRIAESLPAADARSPTPEAAAGQGDPRTSERPTGTYRPNPSTLNAASRPQDPLAPVRPLPAGHPNARVRSNARLRPRRHHRSSVAALALAAALTWLAHPFDHLFGLATPLRLRTAAAPSLAATPTGIEIKAVPRARGVLLDPHLRPPILAVRRFLAAHLHPGETWFDFTSHPILYYLFDRPSPIRHTEIAFAEADDAQRDVIATLDRDTTVRAALLDFPDWFSAIDGVPNRDRAPLVWAYLQQHFAPAYDQQGVVFWLRKPPARQAVDGPAAPGLGR
jgi:hypothetical protein